MELKITKTAKEKPVGGGYLIPINVTRDECCATLTTRYEAIGISNIITLAHFPMTTILVKHEI